MGIAVTSNSEAAAVAAAQAAALANEEKAAAAKAKATPSTTKSTTSMSTAPKATPSVTSSLTQKPGTKTSLLVKPAATKPASTTTSTSTTPIATPTATSSLTQKPGTKPSLLVPAATKPATKPAPTTTVTTVGSGRFGALTGAAPARVVTVSPPSTKSSGGFSFLGTLKSIGNGVKEVGSGVLNIDKGVLSVVPDTIKGTGEEAKSLGSYGLSVLNSVPKLIDGASSATAASAPGVAGASIPSSSAETDQPLGTVVNQMLGTMNLPEDVEKIANARTPSQRATAEQDLGNGLGQIALNFLPGVKGEGAVSTEAATTGSDVVEGTVVGKPAGTAVDKPASTSVSTGVRTPVKVVKGTVVGDDTDLPAAGTTGADTTTRSGRGTVVDNKPPPRAALPAGRSDVPADGSGADTTTGSGRGAAVDKPAPSTVPTTRSDVPGISPQDLQRINAAANSPFNLSQLRGVTEWEPATHSLSSGYNPGGPPDLVSQLNQWGPAGEAGAPAAGVGPAETGEGVPAAAGAGSGAGSAGSGGSGMGDPPDDPGAGAPGAGDENPDGEGVPTTAANNPPGEGEPTAAANMPAAAVPGSAATTAALNDLVSMLSQAGIGGYAREIEAYVGYAAEQMGLPNPLEVASTQTADPQMPASGTGVSGVAAGPETAAAPDTTTAGSTIPTPRPPVQRASELFRPTAADPGAVVPTAGAGDPGAGAPATTAPGAEPTGEGATSTASGPRGHLPQVRQQVAGLNGDPIPVAGTRVGGAIKNLFTSISPIWKGYSGAASDALGDYVKGLGGSREQLAFKNQFNGLSPAQHDAIQGFLGALGSTDPATQAGLVGQLAAASPEELATSLGNITAVPTTQAGADALNGIIEGIRNPPEGVSPTSATNQGLFTLSFPEAVRPTVTSMIDGLEGLDPATQGAAIQQGASDLMGLAAQHNVPASFSRLIDPPPSSSVQGLLQSITGGGVEGYAAAGGARGFAAQSSIDGASGALAKAIGDARASGNPLNALYETGTIVEGGGASAYGGVVGTVISAGMVQGALAGAGDVGSKITIVADGANLPVAQSVANALGIKDLNFQLPPTTVQATNDLVDPADIVMSFGQSSVNGGADSLLGAANAAGKPTMAVGDNADPSVTNRLTTAGNSVVSALPDLGEVATTASGVRQSGGSLTDLMPRPNDIKNAYKAVTEPGEGTPAAVSDGSRFGPGVANGTIKPETMHGGFNELTTRLGPKSAKVADPSTDPTWRNQVANNYPAVRRAGDPSQTPQGIMDQYDNLFQQSRLPATVKDQFTTSAFRLANAGTKDQIILGASAAASAGTVAALSPLWGVHGGAATEIVAGAAGIATTLRQIQILKITDIKRAAEVLTNTPKGDLIKTPIKSLNKVLESQKGNGPAWTRAGFKSDVIRLSTYPITGLATAEQAIVQAGHGFLLADIRGADTIIIGGLATVMGLYGRKIISTEPTADGDLYASPDFQPSKGLGLALDGLAYIPFAVGSAGLITAYQLAHWGLGHTATILGYGRSIGNIGQALGVWYLRGAKALSKSASKVSEKIAGTSSGVGQTIGSLYVGGANKVVYLAGKAYSVYDAVVTSVGAISIIGQAINVQTQLGNDYRAILNGVVDHLGTPPVEGEFEHVDEGK